MRTLRRNKQHMYYCLFLGNEPEYLLDDEGDKVIDHVSSSGEVLYVRTGNKIAKYSEPQGFMGNIAMSSGEIVEMEFGVDVGKYDAILVMDKDVIPITETSLLWLENEPTYLDANKTIIDGSKADYKVLQVKKSLNQTKYILSKIVK